MRRHTKKIKKINNWRVAYAQTAYSVAVFYVVHHFKSFIT